MTTYNTYQEAKIANPDKEIHKHCVNEEYATREESSKRPRDFLLAKCNPADYCMTVEKFLADGYKFQVGDLFIGTGGNVIGVSIGGHLEEMHRSQESDRHCYILRAAVLEEKKEKTIWERVEEDVAAQLLSEMRLEDKKPRTKVEYVKSDIESRGRALDAFDGEVELFEIVDGEYKQVTNESDAISKWRNLYERIETPITWKEELYNYLDNSCEMGDYFDDSFTIEIEGKPLEFNLNDDEFVDMCKIVASLNSVN